MTRDELRIHFKPKLRPGMTWRELVRCYLGPDATDQECDYCWIHVANGLTTWPFIAEEKLAAWCQFRADPLLDVRWFRARDREATV